MAFGVIFNILKLVGGLPFIFNGNAGEKVVEIIGKIRSFSRTDDLNSILERLERDDRFRERLSVKLLKSYKNNAKYKMISKDMVSARKRDIKVRKGFKSNARADWIVLFAVLGIITSVGILIYLRNSLNGELTLIFASVIGFFSSILNDASIFEFGNNIMRVKGK